jgi:SHAQKYF class myb-like DNA-binding protein
VQVLCTQKGLPTKGLKADLVRWLAAYGAAPTDSGRESAKQSAASESSKIREDENKKRRQLQPKTVQKCKCNVPLRNCKRCWGSGVCGHNELRSECWFCAKESPGEDLPLASRTFGQLRVAYDRQGLGETCCPRAKSNLTKSDMLDVLEGLASLGETEHATRLIDLKAYAPRREWTRTPKNGLNTSKKAVQNRKTTAKNSKQHAAQEGAATGRWTAEEHVAFEQGLADVGRDWKSIQKMVPTRSLTQIRTHAQKHFKTAQKQFKAKY